MVTHIVDFVLEPFTYLFSLSQKADALLNDSSKNNWFP